MKAVDPTIAQKWVYRHLYWKESGFQFHFKFPLIFKAVLGLLTWIDSIPLQQSVLFIPNSNIANHPELQGFLAEG